MRSKSGGKLRKKKKETTIKEFLSESTAHGVPMLMGARGAGEKYLWATVVFGVAGFLIFQEAQVISKFLSYPTQFRTEIEVPVVWEFPSVTICSNNPFLASKIFRADGRFGDLSPVNCNDDVSSGPLNAVLIFSSSQGECKINPSAAISETPNGTLCNPICLKNDDPEENKNSLANKTADEAVDDIFSTSSEVMQRFMVNVKGDTTATQDLRCWVVQGHPVQEAVNDFVFDPVEAKKYSDTHPHWWTIRLSLNNIADALGWSNLAAQTATTAAPDEVIVDECTGEVSVIESQPEDSPLKIMMREVCNYDITTGEFLSDNQPNPVLAQVFNDEESSDLDEAEASAILENLPQGGLSFDSWKLLADSTVTGDYSDVIRETSLPTRDEVNRYGVTFDELILHCSYLKSPCTKEDFSE